MTQRLLLVAAPHLVTGCATTAPQHPQEPHYQIGQAGVRQTRTEAERLHVARQSQTGPMASLESPPKLLSSRFPDYPRHLQNAGIEGTVVVRFTVETDGSVSDPAIQGSPPPELAALTTQAIRQWKFAPAMQGGQPIRARLVQPFVFKTE